MATQTGSRPDRVEIRPQAGPQEVFLSTKADIALLGGAAGGGKRLPVDLPIPTPDGWKRNGDLRAGDLVYGEKGTPVRVLVAHPPVLADRAYRLRFDDGTEVEADAGHLWLTYSARELAALTRRDDEWRARRRATRPSRANGHKGEAVANMLAERNVALGLAARRPAPTGTVRTTAEIARTLTTKHGRRNHAIPCTTAIECPERSLPIDPYVLGVWLGDGHTGSGCVTTTDPEILDQLRDAGETVVLQPSQRIGYRVVDLTRRLRSSGLIGSKYIPEAYLRASKAQRLALLQGLMDTDGTVAKASGSAEFCTTAPVLADDVFELIVSLGWKVRLREGRAKLKGRDCGPKWILKWMPTKPVFRLPKKREIQGIATRRTTRFRYVVSCHEVMPRWMRCITVDNPSGLYLAGRSMVPTHNTYALLLEPTRYKENPEFGSVTFRRTYAQVMKEGSLRDTAEQIYPGLKARPLKSGLEWKFPSGMKAAFAHMQHEDTRFDWDGAQIPLICFDQLEHFSKRQFLYMLSRNRTTCGVKPYIRATCNPPGPDHWLREMVDWWIGEDGYPIAERSGVLRWFVVRNDEFIWADSPIELERIYGEDSMPKSFTFIPAKVTDNKILMDVNPEYLANLKALHHVDRERLLGGNWDVREAAGTFFRREWFQVLPSCPPLTQTVRYWDRASTGEDDPGASTASRTAGCQMGKTADGRFVIAHMEVFQKRPGGVMEHVKVLASQDGRGVIVGIEQDPGQAGVAEAQDHVRNLAGYQVVVNRVHERKGVRAKRVATQAEIGNVYLVEGKWNQAFLNEVENFDPQEAESGRLLCDQVDAMSGAFFVLTTSKPARAIRRRR